MTEQQIKELKGLTSEKAKQLQEQYGKNELVAEKKKACLKKFFMSLLYNGQESIANQ
ncbi:MAG: cation-transporting P-type ATPase [Clostridium sp.]|uniref:cation-transporting P-type ATPase n=1 Tax=Clostridium sp. TaxID=1506 RepID=UPI002A83DEFF|nr:cation-transporting P-type ATPase [Clostridium sp.]MCI6691926.1 cation-transporting P-type ATPase [Clostridium sp.]MDY4254033.1 cation-transporting P-type ATPase [Clostridium sp.]